MKKLIIICLVAAFSGVTFAQKNLKNLAKASFEQQNYITAAEILEKLVQKGDSSAETLQKLGDAYYYNANYVKALPAYSRLFKLYSNQSAEYHHRYAQVLKSANKLSSSDSIIAIYCSKFPTELRAKNHSAKQNYTFDKTPFSGVLLTNLGINTPYSDYGATIHGDSIYFASAQPKQAYAEEFTRTAQPFTSLFVADFTDTIVTVSSIYKKNKTFSIFHEATPVFSSDGKIVYYTKNELKPSKINQVVNGRYRIYKAVFEDGKWIDKGLVKILTNDSCRIAHPALSPDNKRLYFSSDMKGSFGQSDIFYVDLLDTNSVLIPHNLGTKINTEGRDSYPFISEDNHLFFASDGHPGLGGFDVFMMDLNTASSKVVHLDSPINSPEDDFAFVWKKTQRKMVLSSNRPGGKGDDDIYAAQLKAVVEIENPILLAGMLRDSISNEPLANARVEIKDALGNSRTALTDSKGNYTFPIAKGMDYTLSFQQEGYLSNTKAITIAKSVEDTVRIISALTQPLPEFGLNCLVTDAKTNVPLPAVSINFQNLSTNKLWFDETSNESGMLSKALIDVILKDTIRYLITLKKPGYFTKVVTFIKTIDRPGIVKVHETLDLSLVKIEEGLDIAKVFKINPIYFDLNKSKIRPDAASELDRIVAIMNENPSIEIELGSHTDCRSSASYNQKLSDNRAKASAEYIKARITNPARIYGKGYGESQLLNGCACEGTIKSTCSEKEHQLNRRTEFKIVGVNGDKTSANNSKVDSEKVPAKEIITKPIPPKQEAPKTALVNNTVYPEGFKVGADLSKLLKIKMIYFDLNKFNIRPDAAIELDKIVKVMNENPSLEIELGSHTDCRSSISYNQNLSDNRAKASAAYIKSKITKPERIYGKGYGESKLINGCACEGTVKSSCTEKEHQQNRRTEFKIIKL